MSEQRRPTNLQHLEKLLTDWSKADPDSPVSAGRYRRLVAVTAIAEMLDGLHLNGADRLVFKGGASFELRFGPTARASKDLDALINVPFDEAWEEISRRLDSGWLGFTGHVRDVSEIIRAGITPLPQRAKIKLAYRGRSFTTIPFELGQAEAGSFAVTDRIPNAIAVDQALLGPPSDVPVLGVHYQIAQKLHACTERYDDGTPNPRVHDLYDILLIEPLATADGLHKTRAACEDTFTHRATHQWPCDVTQWPDWQVAWDGLDIPDERRYPLDDAIEQTAALIARICQA